MDPHPTDQPENERERQKYKLDCIEQEIVRPSGNKQKTEIQTTRKVARLCLP